MAEYTLVSYGVDYEVLDDWTSIPGDMNLTRSVEKIVERLEQLQRKMKWRVKHYGDTVFTPQEVKAMKAELRAIEQTKAGPQRAHKPVEYIAAQLAVTERRVYQLLKSADTMMYFFALANPDWVGWVNEGSATHPYWTLQAPTASETERTIYVVDFVTAAVRKAA